MDAYKHLSDADLLFLIADTIRNGAYQRGKYPDFNLPVEPGEGSFHFHQRVVLDTIFRYPVPVLSALHGAPLPLLADGLPARWEVWEEVNGDWVDHHHRLQKA